VAHRLSFALDTSPGTSRKGRRRIDGRKAGKRHRKYDEKYQRRLHLVAMDRSLWTMDVIMISFDDPMQSIILNHPDMENHFARRSTTPTKNRGLCIQARLKYSCFFLRFYHVRQKVMRGATGAPMYVTDDVHWVSTGTSNLEKRRAINASAPFYANFVGNITIK
jgi:hypothetical protein